MLRVVLIDDCIDELNKIDKLTGEYLKSHDYDFSINRFNSPADFMQSLSFPDKDLHHNLYLLDVMMPSMDGIDLGKEIRKVDRDAKIIYISSSPDFALKSFEARAFYYILKPVDKEQFCSVLDQALESIGYDVLSSINIRTADGSHRVVKGQIMYVELKARKSCYTLVSDTLSSVCLTSSFLSANEELLADRRFLHVEQA